MAQDCRDEAYENEITNSDLLIRFLDIKGSPKLQAELEL
jgi:hypothetical protein